MSADYGTEHLKGFHHQRGGSEWIHVIYRREDYALGDFDREAVIELVELAEQAWPGLAADLADADAARKARDDEEITDEP